ncbi:histidinol-phosphatase HisJ [Bacillus solimangrovi]|uniref:Histidinol-phosphatase n=1 Tax=Bacillus solimangrovi TaxID=1305675 RepID=A0A1E5LCK0_9BACI|nr:histidinol-phosphatase HisJ [Bacillus solimangrovi]OEH91807.1 histidinol phosphatase [Bacillus solimangrovi]
MKRDGHIHTPFCPHGSTDSLDAYIEQAIRDGFTEITFTEHAPLPNGFVDPTPNKDSGMPFENLPLYFEAISKMKEKYKKHIRINRGLEIDYIEGYEYETTSFLNKYGPLLDDAILSVHFLKNESTYYCLDFSDTHFEEIIQSFGSIEKTYECYYNTVLRSIEANLGTYKPRRIGHITLIRKFQKKFPCSNPFTELLENILHATKNAELQLDYNAAGLRKPLCKQTYPSKQLVQRAMQLNIPLIYGSDAHISSDVGKQYQLLQTQLQAN